MNILKWSSLLRFNSITSSRRTGEKNGGVSAAVKVSPHRIRMEKHDDHEQ